MITSTVPLNGSAKGQWDLQGGYGLVQADAALAAIDTLRVVTTTPANATNLTSLPNAIVVTFSRAINPGTVQASDLVFTQVPPGVTVTVLPPVRVNATTYSFPLDVATTTGTLPDGTLFKANGTYAYGCDDGSITSVDGKPLAGFTAGFAVQDTISPRVTNTSFVGRQIVIQFSEAMRESLINRNTIGLYRQVRQRLLAAQRRGPASGDLRRDDEPGDRRPVADAAARPAFGHLLAGRFGPGDGPGGQPPGR